MSWTVSAAYLNISRYAFAHTVMDNRLYLFGGLDEDHQATNTVEYYQDGFWNLSPDTLPYAIYGHSGAKYANNYYIFGGKNDEGYISALWKFSMSEGWEVISDTLPFSPREGYQCVQMDRYIYIIGGVQYSNDGTDSIFFPDVIRYDPFSGNFTMAPFLSRARSDFACGVVNGILYVAGGRSADPSTISSLEFLDLDSEKWVSCNDAPDLEIIPAAFAVKDDILFLLGGQLSIPNSTPTFKTCYGSGQFTGEPQQPADDPQPSLLAFPNPMRDIAMFTFELPYDSRVTFRLYDLRGRLVETIVDDFLVADKYQFAVDGQLISEGLYLGVLRTEKHKTATKLVKVKH
jgi:hypothetical protein